MILTRMLARLLHLAGSLAQSPSERGAYWERVAAAALRKEGLRIVTRNWRKRGRRGEIDIVARDGECLVFVEVRSRGAAALVSGYHSVTQKKKALLREMCQCYLSHLSARPATYRFDVVEISYKSALDYELNHHRNIPLFG